MFDSPVLTMLPNLDYVSSATDLNCLATYLSIVHSIVGSVFYTNIVLISNI